MTKVITIIIITIISFQCWAQNVTGIVTDSETDEAIIGANIIIKNTTNGTSTNIDGLFKLQNVSSSDTLVITYLGYQTLEITVENKSYFTIKLQSKTSELDEVVVVGYGRQKKREITGAISRVTDKTIKEVPILRVEQALQGRTAGVQVTNQSGQPGDEPTVRIRGIGTTGNATPLYIVDGMAVSGIDYLNPGDIESMDVLKDASTAAIYGARAANGVVLITTKSGKAGKSNVSYDGYMGWQNTANRLNMLTADEYKLIMNEGARNAGLSEPFDLDEISTYDTDWQAALFVKNAPLQNHQLTIKGGNEKSTFASSLSYFSQQGVIGGTKSQFDRYTARINSTHQINNWLNFGNNFAYTHLIKRGINANSSFNGAFSSALNMDPLTPAFELDADVLNTYPYNTEPVVVDTAGNVFGISKYVGAEVVNPLALLETNHNETRKDQFVGNIYGEIKPIENLTIKSSLGVDLAYLLDDGFRPLFYLNGAQLNDNKTSVNKEIQRFFTWQWENTIAYEKKFGRHKIGALAGTTASEFQYENLFGSNADVPVNDPENVYLNLAQDTTWMANGRARSSALYSLFGRLNYNFNNKYSLTAIVRRDGSSRFGPNRRFGIFPSIGAAWVISDEAFLKDVEALTYLKLRVSLGVNGNQEIGDNQFVSPINNTRGYTFIDGRSVGSSPEYVENADIGWEQAEQFDIGADAAFFNNQLEITVDYYVKKTKDLLEKISIPAHVGNDGPIANVGTVQNGGIETAVNWRDNIGSFKYNAGIVASFNKNEMIEIGNAEGVINGASWALGGIVTRAEVGLPIGYFWGYQTEGIFQNQNDIFSHINSAGEVLQPNAVPGDVRFVDFNGDGIINDDDRTLIGNPTPDITYGFNAGASYKNFNFSLFILGSQGNDIFNGSQRQDLRFTNRTTKILDRWTGEGTSNITPRYTWADSNNNYRVSDLYIENGSFVRLRNVQLGYRLPTAISEKAKLEKVKLYVSGENLVTLTKYTGADPEIGALSSFDIGIDRGIYPQARTMRVGVEVVF